VNTADAHAGLFLKGRMTQIQALSEIMDRPPLILAPYDAELFGHWWYEGLEFLNYFVRKAYYDQQVFKLITPGQFLNTHSTHQLAAPAPSSWGEAGYWGVWLNEANQWIYPLLQIAQDRMTDLVERFFPRSDPGLQKGSGAGSDAISQLRSRALRQAGRELLLAQASDWAFILRTGTSPNYARKRVTEHLSRFSAIHDQLVGPGINEPWLAEIESRDNIFPDLNPLYFGHNKR
jgi:1,4-alpha-glucan branching enzyme